MVNDPASARFGNLPTYIVDAHALYWYISHPERLSPAAQAVFRLAEAGLARIVVPAIVVAEVYFLTVKRPPALLPSQLLQHLDALYGFALSALGKPQLEVMDTLADVPELHDRLIAADALIHNAPIITRDVSLHRAKSIRAIW